MVRTIAIITHHIPNPQKIRAKTKNGSFMVIKGEALIKFINATLPAPIGPRFIHIVGANVLGRGV